LAIYTLAVNDRNATDTVHNLWEDFMRTHSIHRAAAALIIVLGLAMGSTGAKAAGLGEFCGGFLGIQCTASPGLWCEHPAGHCTFADLGGRCEKIPRFCTRIFKPVCGCNGRTYGNDCERQAARVQLDHVGRCLKKI
jgi:Kazal-type serine protease inhibitor domain